jgi:hypothetical protein
MGLFGVGEMELFGVGRESFAVVVVLLEVKVAKVTKCLDALDWQWGLGWMSRQEFGLSISIPIDKDQATLSLR